MKRLLSAVIVVLFVLRLTLLGVMPVAAQGPDGWFYELCKAAKSGDLGNVYSIGQSMAVEQAVQLATGGSGVGVSLANGTHIAWGPALTQAARTTGYVPIREVIPPAYAPGYAAYSGAALMARLSAAAGSLTQLMSVLSGFYMTRATRDLLIRQYCGNCVTQQ